MADSERMVSERLTVNSPGVPAFDPHQDDCHRIHRPAFPFDEMDDDSPE